MDLDQSPALQIETPIIMNNHILHTKSLTVSRFLSLFVTLSLVLISQSCSRSPYQGSAAYDCEGGDRVILNERLFCVYSELRYTREMPTDMGPADMGPADTDAALFEVEQSDMSLNETQSQAEQNYCPPSLPIAYRYETLTLCSASEIDNELLEAVVATWNELYNETERNDDIDSTDPNNELDSGEDIATDMSTEDEILSNEIDISLDNDEVD